MNISGGLRRSARISNPLPSITGSSIKTELPQSNDQLLVDRFLDAIWMESGLSQHSLTAYGADIPAFSAYLSPHLAVPVSARGHGQITIPFHSEEDFNRIKKLVERAK